MKTSIKILSTALLLSFTLSGCISLTKELPAYKTYSLNAKIEETNTSTNKSIYIQEPRAIGSLNTSAMLYSNDESVLEKYAFSKWSDRPSKMLQELMAKYLVEQNYTFVSTSNLKNSADYIVKSELTSFKQVFKQNTSFIDFEIRVFLENRQNHKINFKNFSYKIESNTNNAQGAINAFNLASKQFITELHLFVQKNIKNDVALSNK